MEGRRGRRRTQRKERSPVHLPYRFPPVPGVSQHVDTRYNPVGVRNRSLSDLRLLRPTSSTRYEPSSRGSDCGVARPQGLSPTRTRRPLPRDNPPVEHMCLLSPLSVSSNIILKHTHFVLFCFYRTTKVLSLGE